MRGADLLRGTESILGTVGLRRLSSFTQDVQCSALTGMTRKEAVRWRKTLTRWNVNGSTSDRVFPLDATANFDVIDGYSGTNEWVRDGRGVARDENQGAGRKEVKTGAEGMVIQAQGRKQRPLPRGK